MCIDTQGCLWVALWGSGKVICVNPKTGVVLHEVLVDGAKLTSSVAFGGENLDTLFITTSQLGLQRSDLDDNPLSGSLFAAHVDAVGTPLFRGGF